MTFNHIPVPARILPLSTHSPSASEPEDPIDIFSLSLSSGTLFPDHAITSHGEPGGQVMYRSPTFGDIVLDIPKHPDEEGGRGLFAHYLWSAATIVAAGVEFGSLREGSKGEGKKNGWWDFRGCRVLEVGAGTALPSIVSALSSAESVYATDHPSSPAITTGTILSNIKQALFPTSSSSTTDISPDTPSQSQPRTKSQLKILPHAWSELSSPSAQSLRNTFDRIIVADCMWLGSQHENLITSILHFLKPTDPSTTTNGNSSSSSTNPCATIVAGFHTGRSIVSSFFTRATSRGLVIRSIYEVDVGNAGSSLEDFAVHPSPSPSSSGDTIATTAASKQRREEGDSSSTLGTVTEDGIPGHRRPFKSCREGESKEESKKWCVVAVLTKRSETTEIQGSELSSHTSKDGAGRGGDEEEEGDNDRGHEKSVWDDAVLGLGARKAGNGSASGSRKKGHYGGQLEVDEIGWV